MYRKAELACIMEAISSGVGIRLYQHLDSVSLSCSVLEIGRRTYLYKSLSLTHVSHGKWRKWSDGVVELRVLVLHDQSCPLLPSSLTVHVFLTRSCDGALCAARCKPPDQYPSMYPLVCDMINVSSVDRGTHRKQHVMLD